TIASNAPAQRNSLTLIQEAESKVTEYKHLLSSTSDKDLWCQIYEKLKDTRTVIEKKRNHLSLFKRHAVSQEKYREKKRRQLDEEGIVEMFDSRGHPSEFQKNPEFKYFPTIKMITNHKKSFHSKKNHKHDMNQTSIHNLNSILIPLPEFTSPYFSADEVTAALDYLNTHQTSTHNLNSISIPSPEFTLLYFSPNEVATLLDYLNTYQIQLSNAAFVEDFSILPSTDPFYLSDVESRDALSDTE
ncbi:10016_t:CDS:2, partial [Racocetra fulgida]